MAVDRSTNSIVVSIRGTLSLHDALTDLRAIPHELNIDGVEDAYAHSVSVETTI